MGSFSSQDGMEFGYWLNEIMAPITLIGYIHLQRKLWIDGDDQVVSSFEETINRLFDDLDFEGFILAYRQQADCKQDIYTAFLVFRDRLNSFLETVPAHSDPKSNLENQEWIRIAQLAKDLKSRIPLRCVPGKMSGWLHEFNSSKWPSVG